MLCALHGSHTDNDSSSDLFSHSFIAADVASYLTKLGNTDSGRFNRSGRAFPDVSAQGVNVEIVFQNQAGLVDGTSQFLVL